MTAQSKKDVKNILDTVAATQDPAVIKEAAKELSAIVESEAKKVRRAQILPTASTYEFKQGEQVALKSADGRVRTEYEYVERLEKFDVIMSLKTGKKHRVWLNKVLPMKIAKAEIEAQNKAAALKQKKQA